MEVILFDGVCNFCNNTVNWIIRHDKQNRFKFATLQSAYGQSVVAQHKLSGDYLDTVILIENEKAYLRSQAILKILWSLGGIYRLAVIFKLIPTPLRDFFYNIVAKYRYRWFGKRDSCMVPDATVKQKFME